MRQQRDLGLDAYDDSTSKIPLLPLKSVVVFPRNVVTLLVARPRSIHAVEEAMLGDRTLAVTAHRDSQLDDPRASDLFDVGTLANLLSVERRPDGNLEVVLEGVGRVRLSQFETTRPFFLVVATPLDEPAAAPSEASVLIQHVQELTSRYAEARGAITAETVDMVKRASHPSHLADLLATQLVPDVPKRQELLELIDPLRRLEQIGAHLSGALDVLDTERRIKTRVREQMDKTQREYWLREQLKAIHDELGGDEGNEFEQLKIKIAARGLPPYVQDKLVRELARFERMTNTSAEASVIRNYIETMLALPWHEETEDRLDLDEAERILHEDHFGLGGVKERILEFLAVRKLTRSTGATASAQILCLVGPPGVGKTSLGRSIATAMGRGFVRVSLGGVRDEAEIRGHRRTYIGAMPGRIISAMKTAGSVNPVILLDEIDKLAADYRGDPTAAMLEVLDPEQNATFTDHFVDVPYDLRRVLFITTANYANQIPRPLRDRMELIEVPGYTEDEKIEIGRRHLLRRQLTGSGLQPEQVDIAESVWRRLIRDYTREAGVRGLDREVASLCRKVATQIVRGKADRDGRVIITEERLEELLGPKKFGYEQGLGESQIGLAIGLGTTDVGGEIIPVEVVTMPGNGALQITGQAGDVMQESARAALSYARSRADQLRIDRDFQQKFDLHIHLPEGATPKDGPSAGITMATALISALTRRPVRNDTAMTGEITLSGRVLAIGGLRDKALAAHRHNIRRLIAPATNERDLRDLPQKVREELDVILVSNMDDVIQAAIMLDVQQADDLQDAGERPLPDPDRLPHFKPDIIDAQGGDLGQAQLR
ncbi:MAG: endopeptidase La [Chloroflexota bacterium]|nr:endopeptidase La [Chloroflexota bacterium]